MRLKGKIAVVTGGASGMGAATVRRFRREGAEVVICDVQTAPGTALAAETGALFVHHDVSQEAAWTDLEKLLRQKYGRLDVMMNNAGVLGDDAILTVTLATWNRVIAINLTGTMLGCRMAVGMMVANPGGPTGSIINVSSSTGLLGMGTDVSYGSSKGGVRILSKSVAVFCARSGYQIRCNSLHPGAIDTPMLSYSFARTPDPEATAEIARNLSPFGRMGSGEDIAAMATFLASDESGFVTGSEMLCDGGLANAHPGF